jgi:hypothetical protein
MAVIPALDDSGVPPATPFTDPEMTSVLFKTEE